MQPDTTVFVVDDDPGALRSLRWLLESNSLYVKTYLSASDFLKDYHPDMPGCLVLDLRMPGISGTELQEQLIARGYQIPVVFVTGHGDVPTSVRAMKAGAVDFLEKPVEERQLVEQIRNALQEDARRRRLFPNRPEVMLRFDSLTPRERQVMHLLADGMATKKIAAELGVSIQTASKHRIRALEKLQVENETELVRLLMNYPPS